MRDPQSLDQCLKRMAATASLTRAGQLAAINRTLSQWCAEPWVRQIRIANLRDQTVVVFSASAAALVPLRHRSQAFLGWLKDHHRLDCTRLEAKVRPPS